MSADEAARAANEKFLADVLAVNGFAAPAEIDTPGGGTFKSFGLTQRAWFAGQVAGQIAGIYGAMRLDNKYRAGACATVAAVSVQVADALIAELNKDRADDR